MIRMTPDTMRERASQYTNQAQNLDTIIRDMDSLLQRLREEWEGQAAEGFTQKFNELRPGFVKAKNLIDDIAAALRSSAQRMEDTDKEIGATWRA